MKKLIVTLITLIFAFSATAGLILEWGHPNPEGLTYKLYEGPDMENMAEVYHGQDMFFNTGDWPTDKTTFYATALNVELKESGPSNVLTYNPLYTAEVLDGNAYMVITAADGTQTHVYLGAEATYTFIVETSVPAPVEIAPPTIVGVQ